MKKENMAAYVGGFFDGEGSIFISKQVRADGRIVHRLYFSIVNTSKEGMGEIAKYLGVPVKARAYGRKKYIRYDIRLSGKRGLLILSTIIDYLIIKKKQMILAQEFERRLQAGRRKLSSKEVVRRDEIMAKMRRLNEGNHGS